MMSSGLYRSGINRGLQRISHVLPRTAVRYSSSKKSGSKPEEHATSTPKKQPLSKLKKERKMSAKADAAKTSATKTSATAKTQAAKTSATAKTSTKAYAQNYVAFKDLPKPSPELQNMSTEQFHARLNMTETPAVGSFQHEEHMPSQAFKYDFELHAKHRLLSRRTPGSASRKPFAAIEPNLALLGLSMDPDTLSSGLEEHPLRESITGMCVMNPLMKEIKNKSLWDFFPETRKYGSSPFGEGAGLNAFKEWEDSKNAKLQVFAQKKQKEEREFRDFCKNLQESNSFVRKPVSNPPPASKTAMADPAPQPDKVDVAPVETTGRRKLDRGLLRQYRKYRKEQYLKDSKDDKEDE